MIKQLFSHITIIRLHFVFFYWVVLIQIKCDYVFKRKILFLVKAN